MELILLGALQNTAKRRVLLPYPLVALATGWLAVPEVRVCGIDSALVFERTNTQHVHMFPAQTWQLNGELVLP